MSPAPARRVPGGARLARPGAPWPRVYRPKLGYRLFLGALGLLALGGAIAVAALFPRGPRGEVATALVIASLLALIGAFLLWALAREQVLLYEDAIEFVELGRGRRRLRRDEIAGRRVVPLQYGQQALVLELRGLGRKPFKTSMICERDEVLDSWLAAIPDLDALDRRRAEAELLQAPGLGATEAERRNALARARRIARGATWGSAGVVAWGWFAPRPYGAAIAALALVPAAALALLLVHRGRYTIERRRNDARPGLEVPVLLPGLVLMLRSMLDFHVVDFRPLLVATAAGTLLLVALVSAGDPALRRRWYLLPVMALLLTAYPYGGLAEANALLDRSEPEVFQVRVIGKRISSGKHTSYDLRLAPWGPYDAPEEVDVGRARYQRIAVGDSVCVLLSRGALGARWYQVDECR